MVDFRAIAAAAQQWAQRSFTPRIAVEFRIAQRLGYTVPVVTHAVDCLFTPITPEALQAVITSELGSMKALDGFIARDGRPAVHARGVNRVTIIASDTTIGVAIPPLIFALCAGAHVTVKDRDDRLVAAFAETLIDQAPRFASHLHVQTWNDHEDPMLGAAIENADVVVAFGNDATMGAIRARCHPQARFLSFGHRTSLAYFPREALTNPTKAYRHARESAVDALLYDGEGCLSTHALFAENGAAVTPRAFAALFARACEDTAVEFPYARGHVEPRVAAYRDRMLFRDAQGLGETHRGGTSPGYLVVFDPPSDEPPPFLPRTIGIYPIDEPAQMLSYIQAHELPLEAIATIANPREDLLNAFLASGCARVTRFGSLQNPPFTGNHGGQGRITPFVRFIYRDDAPAWSRVTQ